MKQPEDMTVREVRDQMRPLLKEGTTCPCCLQNCQIYDRPLTSAMCYVLILIHQRTQTLEHNGATNIYIHIENHLKALSDVPASIRGDFPKLRFWGLIEAMEGEREDKNPSNGYYRITEFGKRFVDLKERVSPVVRLYNNKSLGFKKDMKPISIVDALKKKFKYNELMGIPDLPITEDNFRMNEAGLM